MRHLDGQHRFQECRGDCYGCHHGAAVLMCNMMSNDVNGSWIRMDQLRSDMTMQDHFKASFGWKHSVLAKPTVLKCVEC